MTTAAALARLAIELSGSPADPRSLAAIEAAERGELTPSVLSGAASAEAEAALSDDHGARVAAGAAARLDRDAAEVAAWAVDAAFYRLATVEQRAAEAGDTVGQLMASASIPTVVRYAIWRVREILPGFRPTDEQRAYATRVPSAFGETLADE